MLESGCISSFISNIVIRWRRVVRSLQHPRVLTFDILCCTLTEVPQYLNILHPPGYVMHHQFNIQQLYALSTLYLCVLYLSENKQRLVPLTA